MPRQAARARRPRRRPRAQPAVRMPPVGSATGHPLHPAAVPSRRRVAHRSADVSLLHPDTTEPQLRRRVGALRRSRRGEAARRLPPAVGHQLPRQPLGRGARRAVRQRRRRQARDLQHGRAPAREDRRLHRLHQGRAHEGRREDEGARRGPAARLVPRRGRRAPREGHHPEPDGGEGLPGRRDRLERRAAARRAQAREGRLRRAGRAQGPHPRGRLRRQRGPERPHAAPEDEGNQAARGVLVAHRRRHLTRKRSSRRTPTRSWRTTATRATSRPGSAPPELKTLQDSPDGKTRWIQVRVPVTEGPAVPRWRVHVCRQHGGRSPKGCGRSSS